MMRNAVISILVAGCVAGAVFVFGDDSKIVQYPEVNRIAAEADGLHIEWTGDGEGRFLIEATDDLHEPFAPVSPELDTFHFVDPAFNEKRQRYYRVVDLTLRRPFKSAFSRLKRSEATLPAEEYATFTNNTAEFASLFYRELATDADLNENLISSPYSIAVAFAMAYAGARGDTASEMAGALGYMLPDLQVHEGFNTLSRELEGRGAAIANPDDRFQLNIANDLWGQNGFVFVQDYLNTLATHYGTGINLLDFIAEPDSARTTINGWVESQTNDRITDLMPPGSIDDTTRLVLTNAIYFKAKWNETFGKDRTEDRPFTLRNRDIITAPTMANRSNYPIQEGSGFTAVELSYKGEEIGMLVIMPDEGNFLDFESRLTAAKVAEIASNLRVADVDLTLPKFQFGHTVQLKEVMRSLGMNKAFSMGEADFSGISAQGGLYIQSAIHKAFVSVDEEGTEASAATGIGFGIVSVPKPVTINRPFLFVIHDRPTGTILFIGRVMNPLG